MTVRGTVRRRIAMMMAAVLGAAALAAHGVALTAAPEQFPSHTSGGGWRQALARRFARAARARLLAALQPVGLKNCRFTRFGEPNDGGYVLCANLLDSVQSAYSYGISGYDQWGCDVTRRLGVSVHEYDCFNTTQPACPGGRTVFHAECVAGAAATTDGRLFDTPAHQFQKNGDSGRRVLVKMDVEGAEWDTLLRASDADLQQIDQLAIELHGVDEADRRLAVIERLKQFFYVASLHFNNYSCEPGIEPFPAWAYEVLFVSKRIGVVDGSAASSSPAAEFAPNNPSMPDCQVPRHS